MKFLGELRKTIGRFVIDNAVLFGCNPLIWLYLKCGGDPNIISKGLLDISYASECLTLNNLKGFKLFLDMGFDPKVELGKVDRTALCWAAGRNKSEGLKLYLDKFGYSKEFDCGHNRVITYTNFLGNLENFKLLYNAGARGEGVVEDLLFDAIFNRQENIAKWLMVNHLKEPWVNLKLCAYEIERTGFLRDFFWEQIKAQNIEMSVLGFPIEEILDLVVKES